jgi:putative hydrolase of the HAD superfamily
MKDNFPNSFAYNLIAGEREAREISEARERYQIVFFDATGTLFEVRGGVGEIYSRIALHYGVEGDPDKILQAFSRSFRAQPPLAFPPETPEVELHRLERDWWYSLVRKVFDDSLLPRLDDYFAEVFEYFRSEDAWQLFDDVIPTLTALKDSGMRLAVISNFDTRLEDLLRTLELDRFFDAVHISSRIGAAKPDVMIFKQVLNHHGVESHRALHVGDSLREDAEGAAGAGIHSLLLDRNSEFSGDRQVSRINSLYQLEVLLRKYFVPTVALFGLGFRISW